jgi:hypothetical protein
MPPPLLELAALRKDTLLQASPCLGAFWSPVHFDTQIVPVFLPVQLAVHNVEQVPHTDLLPAGELHQGHPGGDVFVLRHPEGNYVTTRGPRKVSTGQRKQNVRPRARGGMETGLLQQHRCHYTSPPPSAGPGTLPAVLRTRALLPSLSQ